MSDSDRKLTWMRSLDYDVEIRPAPMQRDWMDETSERLAYVCPALNIANTHCWEMLNPVEFRAMWNGEPGTDGLTFFHDEADGPLPVFSGFGHGVLTFRLGGFFGTPKGFDLSLNGPVNRPKDAIQPLSAIVETDWSHFTFTYSWKFTRAGTVVHFEKGEPFCSFFPIPRGMLETFEPQLLEPEDDAERWATNEKLREERKAFNDAVQNDPDSPERKQRWHRNYIGSASRDLQPPHRNRVKLKPFK
ncbi:DUF6065 family protein [Tepidamorphus sp. 3E244]|uniref:DUF6065 family protein n=1 Tax=Tepidamorphus sp. 3E244 TaxID=3385498 RepID=UPI0038FD05C8